MIRMTQAAMLALTKVRTRKIRLIVTVVISGLLFSALAGASMVARGAFASVDSFSKEGFANRYIVQAFPTNNSGFMTNDAIMDRAEEINKDLLARKKREAKRLGIEFAADKEMRVVDENNMPNGRTIRYLNIEHSAAKQAIREYVQAHPLASTKELTQVAKPYGAKAYYQSRSQSYSLEGGRLQVLKDGVETFDQNVKPQMGPPIGIDSFTGSWTLMSSDLLKPFILPSQNLQLGTDGSIPMIVPLTAAEQMLHLKSLPASASSSDRLERIKEVRRNASSITFAACYRNQASSTLVNQAQAARQEIEQNKNKKDYKKPDLQYGLPTEACGAVPVVRDVRTKEQKTADAKQQQFDSLFGEQAASQTKVAFRVVGIVPDADYAPATNVSQIVRSLLVSSLGAGWFSPLEAAVQNPVVPVVFPENDPVATSPPMYYAEFASAMRAKEFIDKQNCSPDWGKAAQAGTDPAQQCVQAGKPFSLNPFGSNSLGLEEARRGFGKIFTLAGIGIAVLASVIMMGTVGKMISDSRRETAVFRAIGAKKIDIAQIYLLYTACISLLVALFALLVGFVGALWVHGHWSAEITRQALVTYNAQDLDRVFRLYTLYVPDVAFTVAIALGAGLLSALFPLFRSLRRNPIKDMRDDT